MAMTYNFLKSIHGRQLALDHDDNLVGPVGFRPRITAATSDTTGTALPNSGIVSVTSTTDDTWTLTDPMLGCEVKLMTGSTSTGTHTISPVAATILSSVGAAGSGIAMIGGGAAICLVGLSTSLWGVTSINSSATSVISS